MFLLGDANNNELKLEQQEFLHSEDTPAAPCLPIPLAN